MSIRLQKYKFWTYVLIPKSEYWRQVWFSLKVGIVAVMAYRDLCSVLKHDLK